MLASRCALLSVVACSLLLSQGVDALRFDVTASKTCVVYFVDGSKGAPSVHVKYESNVTDVLSNKGVDVTVMDPAHNERYRHTIEPKRSNANWHRVPVDISNKALSGFSLSGEYTVCFVAPAHRSILGISSSPYVGHTIYLRNGDEETKDQLKQHTRRKGQGDTSRAPVEKEQCSADSVRQKLDLLEQVHRQMVDVTEAGRYATVRGRRFTITANSLFTRVWFMGILTMSTIAMSLVFSYKAMQRTMTRKRLF
jgi:hypothetical protein